MGLGVNPADVPSDEVGISAAIGARGVGSAGSDGAAMGATKVEVGVISADVTRFESLTLGALRSFCLQQVEHGNRDALVYYLHSKGVTRWRSADEAKRYLLLRSCCFARFPLTNFLRSMPPRVLDWRQFMEHALFEKPQSCIDALLHQGAKVCGVNFRPDPLPHYQGNFWWARCDFVATLPEPMPR
jgi:hypothetical protein